MNTPDSIKLLREIHRHNRTTATQVERLKRRREAALRNKLGGIDNGGRCYVPETKSKEAERSLVKYLSSCARKHSRAFSVYIGVDVSIYSEKPTVSVRISPRGKGLALWRAFELTTMEQARADIADICRRASAAYAVFNEGDDA